MWHKQRHLWCSFLKQLLLFTYLAPLAHFDAKCLPPSALKKIRFSQVKYCKGTENRDYERKEDLQDSIFFATCCKYCSFIECHSLMIFFREVLFFLHFYHSNVAMDKSVLGQQGEICVPLSSKAHLHTDCKWINMILHKNYTVRSIILIRPCRFIQVNQFVLQGC